MAFLEVNFFSDTLHMCSSMNVILPEDLSEGATCPVLYLLHGMSDDHTAWCRYTSIERYANAKHLAVVMPTTGLGWYTDMEIGYDWFTFISKELPQIVHSFFPMISQKREETFVAGLSMGGYGAMKLALHCPEKFAKAGCLSGALDIIGEFKEATAAGPEFAPWPTYWEDIFGNIRTIRKKGNDNLKTAEELAAAGGEKPSFYIWCGTSDFLYKNNLHTVRKLKALGFDVDAHYGVGDHQWKYWDQHIQEILDWMCPDQKEV